VTPLDPARNFAGAAATALERERELGAHGAGHELRLRILEDRPCEHAQGRGSVLARAPARERDAPGEAPAVEVRHQSAGRAQQRRLAVAR